MEKSIDAFRTISEVADDLRLPQHVLRFWETRFPQIRPLKRAGGRRYYRPADTVLLRTIRQLLYEDGYTIKGVQRLLKEQGVKRLSSEGLSFDSGRPPIETSGNDEDGADTCRTEPLQAEALRRSFGDDGGFASTSDADAVARAAEPVPAVADDVGTLREALALVDECLGILRVVR